MKSIKENKNNLTIIKNSKFICYLYKIDNPNDIKKYLETIIEEHHYATHHCYAYILNNQEKASDDGEPSGTAGIPILNVLKSKELTNILAIVVRYFGGIKLGAPGLVRAYTKSVTSTIEKTQIVDLVKGLNISLTFPYKDTKQIDYLLKDEKIINKSYDDLITYTFNIEEDKYDLIKPYNHKINSHILIEKN